MSLVGKGCPFGGGGMDDGVGEFIIPTLLHASFSYFCASRCCNTLSGILGS